MSFSMLRWLLWPGLLLLLACGSSPPPRVYILGAPADPAAGGASETGRPVVQLKTVSLPDYLDTADIQLRDGRNGLKASLTGRWGERLSVGITRALAEALTKRLPGVVVAQSGSAGRAVRTLLIDVDAFDIRPDRRCVLTARWTVLGEDRRAAEASERVTIITMVPQSSNGLADTDVVAAMAEAVDQLADRVGTSLSRALSSTFRNSRGEAQSLHESI